MLDVRKLYHIEEYQSIPTLVFFFQAEDGIRDDLVTGVQTCALPISEFVNLDLGWTEHLPAGTAAPRLDVEKIGRASCRERVEVWGVGISSKKKYVGRRPARGGREGGVRESQREDWPELAKWRTRSD